MDDFVSPRARIAGDERQGREPGHDGRRVGGRHQQIDVTDRLRHPAQRPRVRGATHLAHRFELGEERLGDVEREAHLDAPAGGAELLDPPRDVLLRLRAEAFQSRDPIVVERGGQLVHRGDAQFAIQEQRLLRPEARNGHHLPDPAGDLRPQVLQLGDRARRDEGMDLLPDRRPDAGDLQDLLQVHPGEVGGIASDRAAGLLVRPRLEGVARQDRQQVGVLLKRLLDVVVGPRHEAPTRGRRAGAARLSACGAGSRPDPIPRSAVRPSPRR